jgi:hypothetical protein
MLFRLTTGAPATGTGFAMWHPHYLSRGAVGFSLVWVAGNIDEISQSALVSERWWTRKFQAGF